MENHTTKITIQSGDHITSWETDHDDCDMNELLWAFWGLLISHTWYPSTIISGMKDFVEEMGSDDELS